MRICFFTDIHGNGYAFDAFLDELSKKKNDIVIFGGDFAGYYYDADRIISRVRELRFTCVLGNHDSMFLELLDGKRELASLTGRYGSSYERLQKTIREENKQFLRSLPPFLELEEDGIRMGFFHGSPRNYLNDRIYPDTEISLPEEMELFEKYDVVFCGHTHHKLVKQIGKTLLINPGSAGQQRDGKGTSYVIFDTKTRNYEICTFDYDIEKLEADVERLESNDQVMRERLKEVLRRNR